VAYAGTAHAVVPLTDDSRTIENLLPALSPEMMPVFGSNLGAAIDLAHVLFENAGVRQGRILVLTDGVDQMSHATARRSSRFPMSFMGVGTSAGGTIPLDFAQQPGQVLRSQAGEPILARLDEDRLRSIADVTHGRYRTMGLGDDDLLYLLDTRLPGQDETIEVERDFDLWADMGFWVCLLLIPVVLGAFRRGVLAAVAVLGGPALLLLAPVPAEAGLWDDLWQRRDQQAFQALTQGEPETAAALFNRPDWRAAALYRSGEYQAAAESYRRDPSVTARYNLGNALARQGEYQRAIAAYEQVLSADPGHDDAAFNKALVEKLLDEQPPSDQGAEQEASDGQPDSSTPPQGDRDADQGDQEASPDQPPPGEQPPRANDGNDSSADDGRQGQEEREDFATRDEQQDALDQWLRRVPDDPGGLLRRKFQYETNQRMRRGDYSSRETEKIW
jgi:Ca-activated chloride channel homolog